MQKKQYFVDRLIERVDFGLEDRDEEGSHCQDQRVQLFSLLEDEVAQRRGTGRQLRVTSHQQAHHVDHVLFVLSQSCFSLQLGNTLLIVENVNFFSFVGVNHLDQSINKLGADTLSLHISSIRHSYFQQGQESEEFAHL